MGRNGRHRMIEKDRIVTYNVKTIKASLNHHQMITTISSPFTSLVVPLSSPAESSSWPVGATCIIIAIPLPAGTTHINSTAGCPKKVPISEKFTKMKLELKSNLR